MKTLACVLFVGSLAACADPYPTTPLSQDAHYVALVSPYASPEECLAKASQPMECAISLSLCKNGRAGERFGDTVSEGVYDMGNSVATVNFTDGRTLIFDVAAVADVEDTSTHWIVDTQDRWNTLQFDNIDCGQSYQRD
jgi:hypothetical protein